MKEFSLYSADINEFLKKGGTVAWGIVPSSEEAAKESDERLAKSLKEGILALADKGVDTKNISSVVTPSCGLGTLPEAVAENIIKLTSGVSRRLI